MTQIFMDIWPKPQRAWHLMGPDPTEDGWHLIQLNDGSLHNFCGSTTKGWFGSDPASWETK